MDLEEKTLVDEDQPGKSWYESFASKLALIHRPGGTSYIKIPEQISLTEQNKMVDTPATIKRQLLDNQRTQLAAIMEFESKTAFEFESEYMTMTCHHSGIRESEDPGSGKTIISIALVGSGISPTPRPIINPVRPMWRGYGKKAKRTAYATIREFPEDRVFPCTVFTVSRGVFGQWEDEFKRFSSARVLSISNVNAFRLFYVMVQSDLQSLRNYDVILLKNGKMTGHCPSPYVEHINRNSTAVNLYSKFVELVRNIMFWRVINDDIDMSKLPSPTPVINAYSTINISATAKK